MLDDSGCDPEYGPALNYFRVINPWTDDYFFNPIGYARNWFSRFVCRWRGHPKGVWWMNSCGFEPDMHCKGCGQNLG